MFRTIETCEPPPQFEGLRFVTVKSRALRARADITLFVPDAAAGATSIPLVILLHGVYGSHWGWALKGEAHRTLSRLVKAGEVPPLALAMPSDGLWGDGSGYLPHPGRDFERWIMEDVPASAAATLPGVTEQSRRFIAGLSMGGFGALRLGAKYPHHFRAIAGHSSITHFQQMKQFVEEPLETYGVRPEDQSVFETMLRHRQSLPPIRFDCGTEDPLIEENRLLHRQLTEAGIAHVYQENPGGHDWNYWARHLADTLRFFAGILRGT